MSIWINVVLTWIAIICVIVLCVIWAPLIFILMALCLFTFMTTIIATAFMPMPKFPRY